MENYTVQDLEQLTIRQVTDLVIALREEIKSLYTEEDRIKIMEIGLHSTGNVPINRIISFAEDLIQSRLSPEKQITANSLRELKFKIFDATNID